MSINGHDISESNTREEGLTVAEIVATLAEGKTLQLSCSTIKEAQNLRSRIAVTKMRQDKQLASILNIIPNVLTSTVTTDKDTGQVTLTVRYSEERKKAKSFSFKILEE